MSAPAGYSLAPGDVSPGHMMLAPLRTNLMAPLSTCWCGRMKGSMKRKNGNFFFFFYQCEKNNHVKQLALCDLTFMQQSEGGVEWSFSLSEEEQLSVHCQDFNVFMAVGRIINIKTVGENPLYWKHTAWHDKVIPSHYFDRVLFWHYVIEPWLDVGKLFQQLVFDAFNHWCFQLDTVRHVLLLIESETGNRTNFCVMFITWWKSFIRQSLILILYF